MAEPVNPVTIPSLLSGKVLAGLLASLCLGLPGAAPGHGYLAKEEQFPAGIPVEPGDWPRHALSHDGGGWRPTTLTFDFGTIITFDLHNASGDDHLFAIGTGRAQSDQAQMHQLMPEQRTDYPNTRWLRPDERATLSWEFNRSGRFQGACLLPGHRGEQAITLIVSPPPRP